jgi:hypothetical protein
MGANHHFGLGAPVSELVGAGQQRRLQPEQLHVAQHHREVIGVQRLLLVGEFELDQPPDVDVGAR